MSQQITNRRPRSGAIFPQGVIEPGNALLPNLSPRSSQTFFRTNLEEVRSASSRAPLHEVKIHGQINTYKRTRPAQIDFSEVCLSNLREKKTWADKEYRHAYAVAAVEQGIAWQLRLNREARGMSQADLATLLGTKQSSVSRMEDPEYGSHSLPTLLKAADAFDCALLVKFIPFSILAIESRNLSEEQLLASSYSEEIGKTNG